MATALPEPSRTYMTYVNDRAVDKLGPVLVPFLRAARRPTTPALSPQRAAPPAAPVFLLHGDEDTVIPPAESVMLGEALRSKGADVRVLLSHIITHAELDRAGDYLRGLEADRLLGGSAGPIARATRSKVNQHVLQRQFAPAYLPRPVCGFRPIPVDEIRHAFACQEP